MNCVHKFLLEAMEGASTRLTDNFYRSEHSNPKEIWCLYKGITQNLCLNDLNIMAETTNLEDLSIYLIDPNKFVRELAQLRCKEIEDAL